jgi:hypothetical protein
MTGLLSRRLHVVIFAYVRNLSRVRRFLLNLTLSLLSVNRGFTVPANAYRASATALGAIPPFGGPQVHGEGNVRQENKRAR